MGHCPLFPLFIYLPGLRQSERITEEKAKVLDGHIDKLVTKLKQDRKKTNHVINRLQVKHWGLID